MTTRRYWPYPGNTEASLSGASSGLSSSVPLATNPGTQTLIIQTHILRLTPMPLYFLYRTPSPLNPHCTVLESLVRHISCVFFGFFATPLSPSLPRPSLPHQRRGHLTGIISGCCQLTPEPSLPEQTHQRLAHPSTEQLGSEVISMGTGNSCLLCDS